MSSAADSCLVCARALGIMTLSGFCFFLVIITRASGSPYFTEWNIVGSRLTQPTCVDIPSNLTLCHGIGYTKMRLPNLLDHDSMAEVSQQAGSWVPLFNLKCHPDTQLFLCSLFSPVCLDRPIYPCRSLCIAVQQGCENRMQAYGYPWPDMVRCDKFPVDNDMCITVQSHVNGDTGPCTACHQAETYENIIDHYCRSDFVIKTKFRRLKKQKLHCKKAKILKLRNGMTKKDIRRPIFKHTNMTECCGELIRNAGKKKGVLIMGSKTQNGLSPTFIMEWKKTSMFKKAVRSMSSIDCSSPKLLSQTMEKDGMLPGNSSYKDGKRRKGRSRKNKPKET